MNGGEWTNTPTQHTPYQYILVITALCDTPYEHFHSHSHSSLPSYECHSDDDEDGSAALLHTFANKKKEFIAKKKAHYTVEPKYGGRVESLPARWLLLRQPTVKSPLSWSI